MPACDVVAPRYICDVRFNNVTSFLRHIYAAIFFFNTEKKSEINVFRISKHKSLEKKIKKM